MHTNNLVLIDGDIIVYRVAFACQHNNPETKEIELENVDIVKSRVDQMLTDILENTDAGECMGWLTQGTDNFRNKVAVTAPYKGNRFQVKPLYYGFIRDYLKDEHGFEMCYTQEADDAIGITHMDISNGNLNEPIVIASIDKDLLMIPGQHYNIATRERATIAPNIAMKKFFTQVLTGDRADNIIGLHGVGPVKAAKILDNAVGFDDMFRRCARAYAEADPNNWMDRLTENGELLWIRRVALEEFKWRHVDKVYSMYGYPIKAKAKTEDINEPV